MRDFISNNSGDYPGQNILDISTSYRGIQLWKPVGTYSLFRRDNFNAAFYFGMYVMRGEGSRRTFGIRRYCHYILCFLYSHYMVLDTARVGVCSFNQWYYKCQRRYRYFVLYLSVMMLCLNNLSCSFGSDAEVVKIFGWKSSCVCFSTDSYYPTKIHSLTRQCFTHFSENPDDGTNSELSERRD